MLHCSKEYKDQKKKMIYIYILRPKNYGSLPINNNSVVHIKTKMECT